MVSFQSPFHTLNSHHHTYSNVNSTYKNRGRPFGLSPVFLHHFKFYLEYRLLFVCHRGAFKNWCMNGVNHKSQVNFWLVAKAFLTPIIIQTKFRLVFPFILFSLLLFVFRKKERFLVTFFNF